MTGATNGSGNGSLTYILHTFPSVGILFCSTQTKLYVDTSLVTVQYLGDRIECDESLSTIQICQTTGGEVELHWGISLLIKMEDAVNFDKVGCYMRPSHSRLSLPSCKS